MLLSLLRHNLEAEAAADALRQKGTAEEQEHASWQLDTDALSFAVPALIKGRAGC